MNAVLAALLLAAPARAIELALEENRAERGSVGFVDIQRLFTASPDAARAKESFAELVRQAEERVNLKKTEGLKVQQELDSTRVERDSLAKSTPTPAAAPLPAPEPPKASSAPIALPGMAPAAPAPSAPAAPPVPPGADAARRLMELDGRIAGLEADLRRREAELQRERQDADKGLVNVEGRKTDQVLARLYRAINEVARKEGVSVVVDKSAILYGHPAVDLTDKVLASLKGGPQP